MKKYNDESFRVDDYLNSDLSKWILGFIEVYDGYFYNNAIQSYRDWLKKGKYDCIRHFLKTNIFEYSLPFGLEYFNQLSVENFKFIQEETKKVEALLDEKKALYQQFIEFFD